MRIRPTEGRRSIRTSLRRVAAATAAVVVSTSLLFAAPASAGVPGTFNSAVCMPGTQLVQQQIEVKRSNLGEYIYLQGALVDQYTGKATLSNWTPPDQQQFDNAYATVTHARVPRSDYTVWYHWASWDYAKSTWVLSGWIQLTGAQLNTFGRNETMEGSDLYISPRQTLGYCTI